MKINIKWLEINYESFLKSRQSQHSNWRFGIHPSESFWIRTMNDFCKWTRRKINYLHSHGIYICKDPKYLYVELPALVQKMQDKTQLHTLQTGGEKSTRRVFARAMFATKKLTQLNMFLLFAYGLTISQKHDLSALFVTTHCCPSSANQIMEIGP